MSDVGSSLAKLGGEELNDIGLLLDLKFGGRPAPVKRLAITQKLTKMGLTGRLSHLLFLSSPAGELIGIAPSSKPFVAATAVAVTNLQSIHIPQTVGAGSTRAEIGAY